MGAYVRGQRVTGFVDCSGLFSKNHTIERWHSKITAELHEAAKRYCPESPGNDPRPNRVPGRLKRSIRSSPPDRLAPKFLEARVSASTPYARFVHEGTEGQIIYPRRSRVLLLPGGDWARPGEARNMWGGLLVGRASVKGQKAQPFLVEAMWEVGALHGWRESRLRAPR